MENQQTIEEVGVQAAERNSSQNLEMSGQESGLSENGRMNQTATGPQKGGEEFNLLKMMELLWEDRRHREAEQFDDRRRWEEERRRREAEHKQHVQQMQLQLDMMKSLMERSQAREDELAKRAKKGHDQLKLTKLTKSEDIEAYLTTFERMMQVYEVDEDRWAFMLAPQLTGKAQKAYAALKAEDATHYSEVKSEDIISMRRPTGKDSEMQEERIVNLTWSW